MKYLVWIITIFLNVTGHHFLPKEPRRSRASLNDYTGYENMKYVLLTGNPRNDETAQMEVMDERGSTKICNSKSIYPLKVEDATAVFTDNYIIVCGGYRTNSACYTYADNQQGWTKLADMDTPRYGSASVSIDDGILVTGGYDGSNYVKTSEIVFLNGTVKQGKPLPEPRYGHCLVEYQGHIISTGGRDGNGDENSIVWLFNNHEEFTMTNLPSMIYKRYGHACGIVHSSLHNGRPLLVVAGSNQGDGRDKSEFWDFTVPGSQWQSCSEDLPVHMWNGPKMTHTADKKNLLMTYEKSIYSFHCRSSSDCHWKKENYELKTSRRFPVLTAVPSSLVENC